MMRTECNALVAQKVTHEGPPLLDHDAIITMAVPAEAARSGIYFLIRDGRVVYVGQSIHVAWRVAVHGTQFPAKRFDSWAWMSCAVKDLATTERAYLDQFLPEDNQDHTTRWMRRRRRSLVSGLPATDLPSRPIDSGYDPADNAGADREFEKQRGKIRQMRAMHRALK